MYPCVVMVVMMKDAVKVLVQRSVNGLNAVGVSEESIMQPLAATTVQGNNSQG